MYSEVQVIEDLESGSEVDETAPEDEKEKNKNRFIPVEQRSQVESDRRSEDSRRHSEEDFDGEEKRQEPERRSQSKRRSITFEIIFRTSGSLTTIEDWLDDHCLGEWNLILDALDENLSGKNIKVMFELAEDREKFIQVYGGGGRNED